MLEQIKIMRRKSTGTPVICVFNNGQWKYYECVDNDDAKKQLKRIKRNAQKRAENEILRDITGTSAAAARRDRGI